jgi:outer membrane protein assembly factor BamB
MARSKVIYLGIKGSVLALDSASGQQLWATSSKGSDFVNIALDGGDLYAATRGEVFCLDPDSGIIRWHNPLKGYGWGLVSFAGEGMTQNVPILAEEKRRREQQQAASSG